MADIRVLALTRYDRMGASSRLRFYDYRSLLEKAGIQLTISPFFDDRYLTELYAGGRQDRRMLLGYYRKRLAALKSIRNYDVVWLEKEALPWLPSWVERRYLKRKPYVIDFDDAWFYRYDQHPDPVVRYFLQGKFARLVKAATVTVVGNAYLAGWAKASGAKPITQVPTTVDLPRYTVASHAMVSADAPRPFTIGWIGSPSSAKYLRNVAPALAEFAEGDDFSVTVVGAGDEDLPIPAMRRLPWREDKEFALLSGFDVGIMPLDSDKWSEGKCAYKLIQYMAAGLPVIASPIGMNRDVVKDGENGFLATSREDWVNALRTLKDDPTLRQQMGKAGRERVERDFSLAGNAPRMADILRKAAGRKGK